MHDGRGALYKPALYKPALIHNNYLCNVLTYILIYRQGFTPQLVLAHLDEETPERSLRRSEAKRS